MEMVGLTDGVREGNLVGDSDLVGVNDGSALGDTDGFVDGAKLGDRAAVG